MEKFNYNLIVERFLVRRALKSIQNIFSRLYTVCIACKKCKYRRINGDGCNWHRCPVLNNKGENK